MLLYPIVWVQTALTIFFSLQLGYDDSSIKLFSPIVLGITGSLDTLVTEWIPQMLNLSGDIYYIEDDSVFTDLSDDNYSLFRIEGDPTENVFLILRGELWKLS